MRGEDPKQQELQDCKNKTVEIGRVVENAKQPAQNDTETRQDEEISQTSHHVPVDSLNSEQTRSSTEETIKEDETPVSVFTPSERSSSVEKETKLTADSSQEYESRSLLMSEMRKYVIKSRKATIHSHKYTVTQPETKQPKKNVISSYASAMAAFDHKAACAPRPVPKMNIDASGQNNSKNWKEKESEDMALKRMIALHSSSDRTLVTTNTTASVRNFVSNTPKPAGRVIVTNQLKSPFEVTPSKRLFYFNKLKAAKNDPQSEDIPKSTVCSPISKEERASSFNNFQKKSSDEDRQSILRKLRNEKRRMELERTKKSVIKERTTLLNHVKEYSSRKSRFHESIEPRTFYAVPKHDEETGNQEEMKKRNTARRKELLSRARSYKRLDDQQKKSANTEEDFDIGSERRENFLLDNFRAAQSFFTLEKANTQRTEIELNNEDEPMKVDVNENETKKNAFIDNFRAAHSFFTNEIMKADTKKHQEDTDIEDGRLKSVLQKESSRNRTDPIQEMLMTIISEPNLPDKIPKQIFIQSHEEIDTVVSKLLQKEHGHATQESVFQAGVDEVATMQVSDIPNQVLVYGEEEKKNVQSKSRGKERSVDPSVSLSTHNVVATTTQQDEVQFSTKLSSRISDRRSIAARSDSERETIHEETLDKNKHRRKDGSAKEMVRCNPLGQESEQEEIKYHTKSLLSSSDSSESSSLDEKETSLRVLFHKSMKKLSTLLGESKSEDSSFESFVSDDDSSARS